MAALKAVQPAETPDPAPTPPQILAQFQAEQVKLREELAALAGTRDLSRLDALATIKTKLDHIDGLLPELEEEALQYEQDARLAAARARAQPLWQAQAQRKSASRAIIAAATRDIVSANMEYRLAHENQMHLLDQVSLRRGAYGALVAQLVQCMQTAVSLTDTAAAWQSQLATFDGPGCSPVLPTSQIM